MLSGADGAVSLPVFRGAGDGTGAGAVSGTGLGAGAGSLLSSSTASPMRLWSVPIVTIVLSPFLLRRNKATSTIRATTPTPPTTSIADERLGLGLASVPGAGAGLARRAMTSSAAGVAGVIA